MSGFIQMTPDAFSLPKDKGPGSKPEFVDGNDIGRYDHVRRPVRGTQPKAETFATLEVKTKDGKNLLLFDSGGAVDKGGKSFTPRYSNFLMQSIQESRVEKSQMVETFGPTYIFFFGERPSVFNISGMLLNSSDFNWKAEFWENYDRYLRGTQCVTNATRVYLSYDDIVLQGYILSANVDNDSEKPELCPFGFQMVISNYLNTSSIGDPKFPIISPTAVTEVNETFNQSEESKIRGTVEEMIHKIDAPFNYLNSMGPTAQSQSTYEAIYSNIIDNDDEYVVRPPRNPSSTTLPKQSFMNRIPEIVAGGSSLFEVAMFATINITGLAKQSEQNNGPRPLEGAESKDKNTESNMDKAKDERIEDRVGRT